MLKFPLIVKLDQFLLLPPQTSFHEKWGMVSQIGWIKSTRKRSVLIIFALSELSSFIKWHCLKARAMKKYIVAFLLQFSPVLWSLQDISFQLEENPYVQRGSFISLYISRTTKHLPSVIGQKFLKGIDDAWSSKECRQGCRILSIFLGLKINLKWRVKSIRILIK